MNSCSKIANDSGREDQANFIFYVTHFQGQDQKKKLVQNETFRMQTVLFTNFV